MAEDTGRVVVVGGGVGGAITALRLAQAGQEVVLLERGDHLGGLLMSLRVGETPIERFYHHIFPHEHEIISLIGELGLADRLEWRPSSVGMLLDGRLWPFTSPIDLLRYQPLPIADRIHTGIGALRSSLWTDWSSLDTVPAKEWLTRLTGERGMQEVWEPLLRAKFGSAADDVPAAWMWGRFLQRRAARRGGVERLGYLRGGFRQLFDALQVELTRQGVKTQLGTAVEGISVEAGVSGPVVNGVLTDRGPIEGDVVVYAGTLPGLSPLVPEECRDGRWSAIGGIGAMAVVVELARRITDLYWVNVCDHELPLTVYIEHTNFMPTSDYGGRHVAYLARYFTANDPIARVNVDEEAARWIDVLAGGGLPGLHTRDVIAVHPARTPYAAPLVQLGYLARIPPVRSHIKGLYVATSAQIYPQDRGMSEGIRLGTEAAHHVIADRRARLGRNHRPAAGDRHGRSARRAGQGWACPVCGGDRFHPRYASPEDGSEGGVRADAFRPSSGQFGRPTGSVVSCTGCGHGSLNELPESGAIAAAYEDAADPVSLREEQGQVATGTRAFERIESVVRPGRFADIGCWTGSLLVAGQSRGWDVTGVEPSAWATKRARERGLNVRTGFIHEHDLRAGSYRAIAVCDVLEHLEDPAAAVDEIHRLLEPGGVLYITVPDAGSLLARAMGRRWWSVLPMHLQYFTRGSMRRLLNAHGFRIVSERTHAKVFTARYYAERLGGYRPRLARAAVRGLEVVGFDTRLVAPDLRDRLEVIAVAR
jgi:protoporphyrinogen oxidase/SAM-dependent methyltransferase